MLRGWERRSLIAYGAESCRRRWWETGDCTWPSRVLTSQGFAMGDGWRAMCVFDPFLMARHTIVVKYSYERVRHIIFMHIE